MRSPRLTVSDLCSVHVSQQIFGQMRAGIPTQLKVFDCEPAAKRREQLSLVCALDSGHNQVRFGKIRSEEHTSELQSLMRISYAVFCLKKKKQLYDTHTTVYRNPNTTTINNFSNLTSLHEALRITIYNQTYTPQRTQN